MVTKLKLILFFIVSLLLLTNLAFAACSKEAKIESNQKTGCSSCCCNCCK